jgi:hypothetical protein
MPSTGSSSSSDRTFEVLALDYEMAREDERTFAHIQANVAAITVALLAAIVAVVSDTCQLSSPPPHPTPPPPYPASTEQQCDTVPDLFLAGAPAIPLAALAFLQLLGTAASLRSYYIRAIEKELRSYAPSPLSGLMAVAPIKPASYHGLIIEAITLRRGWTGYRILALMIMLTALGVFGGLTVFIANSLGGTYRTVMLLGYGSAFALLVVEVVGATFGARTAFVQVAKKFYARQGGLISQSAASPPVGRSLLPPTASS